MAQRGLPSGGTRRGGLAVCSQALDLARQLKERGNEALALHQLASSRPMPTPPMARRLKPITSKPWPWPRSWACIPLQAHCHRGLGTLYTKIDQPEQARTELLTAITMYRSMDMTFWLPETEAALAQVEGR